MEKEESIGKDIKEIVGPIRKIIGLGATFGIATLAERLSRRYGQGTLTKEILDSIQKGIKGSKNG